MTTEIILRCLPYFSRVTYSPGIAERTRSADRRKSEGIIASLFKKDKSEHSKKDKPEHSQPKKRKTVVTETAGSGVDKNKNANTKQSKSTLDQGQKQGLVLTTKPLVDREASFESVKGCPVASNSSFSLFGNKGKGSKVILSRSETVVKETKETVVKETKEIPKSSKTKAGKKRKSSGSSVKSETSTLSLVESASVSSAGSASTYCSGVSGSNLSSLLTCDLHKESSKGKGRKGRKSKIPLPTPSLSVQGLPESSEIPDTSQTATAASENSTSSKPSKRSRSKSGGHKKGRPKGQSSSTVQSSETVEPPKRESVIKSVGKTKKSDSVRPDIKGASVTLSGASIAPSNTSQVTYIQPPKKRSKWDRQKESTSTSVSKETPSTSSAVSPPGRCGLRRKNRNKNTGSCASSR